MKFVITENKLERLAIKWLNENYGDLEPFETEKYPDYIFYRKGDEVIFDYNKKNKVVYVSYDEIWSFFESFFGMDYQQIRDITKDWVEEHYKLRVTTTTGTRKQLSFRWRNIIN
jgi:hypothetical protein